MVEVYGISNCDSVKKTLSWLKENNIAFKFHDFKKEGISSHKIREWIKASAPEKVLNKKSTAYRSLLPEDQQKSAIKEDAIRLMEANTNLIKRPVVEIAGIVLHGFNIEEYKKAFDKT